MFERFTNEARRVLVVAQDEARSLQHSFIEPEHLFLGLLQGEGVAARALGQLDVSLERARDAVAASLAPSKTKARTSKLPFSTQAKRSLEMSLREALRLGHNYIGTEHIALGILRATGDSTVVVETLGVETDEVRSRVLAVMANGAGPDSPLSPALAKALERAREVAGAGPVTTGQLVLAMLADDSSHAAKALEALGVTSASLDAQLMALPVSATSDASPLPLEITIGKLSATINDPELVAALGDLTPELLAAALRETFALKPKRAPGSAP